MKGCAKLQGCNFHTMKSGLLRLQVISRQTVRENYVCFPLGSHCYLLFCSRFECNSLAKRCFGFCERQLYNVFGLFENWSDFLSLLQNCLFTYFLSVFLSRVLCFLFLLFNIFFYFCVSSPVIFPFLHTHRHIVNKTFHFPFLSIFSF